MTKAKKVETEDEKDARLQEIGRCAFESIAEMVARLEAVRQVSECCAADTTTRKDPVLGDVVFCDDCEKACTLEDSDEPDEDAREKAREKIQEDPLSVEVRGDWRTPGGPDEEPPTEFRILLSTGGPATRIVGELDQYGQPTRAWLEAQDWFQPWTEYRGQWGNGGADVIMAYASCFYFGEG